MAAERRIAAQAGQQQVVLDYVADGGCDAVELGDTRLGNDAAKMNRMVRGVMGRISDEQRRCDSAGLREEQRAVAMAQRRKVGKAQWDSAGSHRDENEIWRGGIALGSYGEAAAGMSGLISDCPEWGRYTGIYIHGQRWETVGGGGGGGGGGDLRTGRSARCSERQAGRLLATTWATCGGGGRRHDGEEVEVGDGSAEAHSRADAASEAPAL